MEFLWPWMLYGLVILPALIIAYIVIQRRRKIYAIRYSSLTLVKDSAGKRPSWRRHIPPFVFLLSVAAMLLALARPFSIITLPAQEGVVILAIDVSGSMRAQDIQPSRIEAAKIAAMDFISKQEPSTRIGVVAFSGNAALVQPPTTDHKSAAEAVDRLTLGPRTGIGNAILASVDAIYEALDKTSDSPVSKPTPPSSTSRGSPTPTPRPVAPGFHVPAIVVLLTDGQSNAGVLPVDAAQIAADRGVRIFTVGVGTTGGATIGGGGFGGPGGPGGGGGGFRTSLDENTLREVARITDAKYFYAKDEADLREIYSTLNTQLILRTQRAEITFAFTAGAIILLLVGATLSLMWFNRLP
jgi:Ca-activated chloride channel family protein